VLAEPDADGPCDSPHGERAHYADTWNRNRNVNRAGRPHRDVHGLAWIDDRHSLDRTHSFSIDFGGRIARMARDRNQQHQSGETGFFSNMSV
jgi:hypothetical protein